MTARVFTNLKRLRVSAKYLITDKYRSGNSIDSGHKNLLKITTAGSSVDGQAFSGVYEESSTSSIQGVDSHTFSSVKSRDEKSCDSSRMSNAGWLLLLASFFRTIFFLDCGFLKHMYDYLPLGYAR